MGASLSHELAALLFGTVFGGFVQWVALASRYNGEWERLPRRKRFALVATGNIASLVAGLLILNSSEVPTANPPNMKPYYLMWLAQIGAAWAGGQVLDALQTDMPGLLRRILGVLLERGDDKRR
jgi:hypothetical protein